MTMLRVAPLLPNLYEIQQSDSVCKRCMLLNACFNHDIHMLTQRDMTINIIRWVNEEERVQCLECLMVNVLMIYGIGKS